MTSIITELVYIIICLGTNRRTHPGAGVPRYIEDPLVAFGCCLLYGRVVVALTHSPFPFSILCYKFYRTFFIQYIKTGVIFLSSSLNFNLHVRQLVNYPPVQNVASNAKP